MSSDAADRDVVATPSSPPEARGLGISVERLNQRALRSVAQVLAPIDAKRRSGRTRRRLSPFCPNSRSFSCVQPSSVRGRGHALISAQQALCEFRHMIVDLRIVRHTELLAERCGGSPAFPPTVCIPEYAQCSGSLITNPHFPRFADASYPSSSSSVPRAVESGSEIPALGVKTDTPDRCRTGTAFDVLSRARQQPSPSPLASWPAPHWSVISAQPMPRRFLAPARPRLRAANLATTATPMADVCTFRTATPVVRPSDARTAPTATRSIGREPALGTGASPGRRTAETETETAASARCLVAVRFRSRPTLIARFGS